MPKRVTKHFVNVGGRQVHYRRIGEGPPVVMVHESPTTGVMLLPLARQLADLGYTALPVDTPGYGGSDPFPDIAEPSIADYADGLLETLDALGLKRPHVYGSHTGAMIVLELGLRHPRATRSLVIDGLPAFTRPESIELRMNWLAEYRPHASGSHLVELWHRYRDHTMFWPWYEPKGDSRFEIDMPSPEHIQERIVDWLLPGEDYTPSYNAAFDYDGHLRVGELTCRAALTAHHDDLLGFSMERLPEKLGRRTLKARMPKSQHARWISRFFGKEKGPQAPPAPEPEPLPGRVGRTYVRSGGRELLVRRRQDVSGHPLVLLPAAPDTGSGLRGLLGALGETRPVYAIDLPGTGGSDPLRKRAPSIDEFAVSVAGAIRGLGLRRFDLYGAGVGAAVALALARFRPRAVTRLVIDGLPLPDRGARGGLRRHVDATVVPEHDGSHLVRAWTHVRDHELYAPWFDRTKGAIRHVTPAPPTEIHRRTLELLKAPTTFWLPERAALDYALERALRSAPGHTLVCSLAGDVASGDARRVARHADTRAVIFESGAERTSGITAFLS